MKTIIFGNFEIQNTLIILKINLEYYLNAKFQKILVMKSLSEIEIENKCVIKTSSNSN